MIEPKPLRVLLLEALPWLLLPGVFLWAYVEQYSASVESVIPHLWLVLHAWLFLIGARILLYRLFWRHRWPELVSVLMSAIMLFSLAGYYVLVLTGLASWGRVITSQLIATYAMQWSDLIGVLGLNATVIWLLFVGLALAAALGLLFWPSRWRWIRPTLSRLSSPTSVFVALGLLAISATGVVGFVQKPPVSAGEPLALTFYAHRSVNVAQLRTLSSSRILEEMESVARQAYVPNPHAQRRNVILVVSDALRPDHMGVYGYARPTTPFLTELDNEGMLHKQAKIWAVCAESACGLLAIARSKYPHQQTINAVSLPEVLKLHGYRSHLILGGDHTNFYGLREGYGVVDSYFDGASAAGYYMNDDAFLLARSSMLPQFDETPVFLQYHFMSTHGLGRRHSEYLAFQPWKNYYNKIGLAADNQDGLRREAINYYDSGVLQFDQLLKQLVSVLEKKGYLRDALLVITSDHGEMLGENGKFSHAGMVNEPVLRVPLLVVDFKVRRAPLWGTSLPASQIDIAPTILRHLDMPAPSTWTGLALQNNAKRRHLYFQQENMVGLLDFSQREGILKYWIDVTSGAEHFLDVGSGEERVVDARDAAALVAAWRGELAHLIIAIAPGQAEPINDR